MPVFELPSFNQPVLRVTCVAGLLALLAGCGSRTHALVEPPSAPPPRPTVAVASASANPTPSSAPAPVPPKAAPTEVRVVRTVEPSERSCYELRYTGLTQKLLPGEAVTLTVPPDYADKAVGFVTLAHAQTHPWEGKRDPEPGLTSVQYRWTVDGTWRYWGGPSSGRDGAKFAEFRDGAFEREGLYEFGHYGHVAVGKALSGRGPHGSVLPQDTTTSPLTISEARVVSVGTDEVVVDAVGLKFWPKVAGHLKEYAVIQGQKFGEYATSEHAEYSFDRAKSWKLPTSKRDSRGDLRLDRDIVLSLSKYRTLRSVEVIVGDAPEQGGRPGRAQLSIYVKNPDGTKVHWMKDENVPPVGILKAARPECDGTLPPGAELVISGAADDMWVSGVRIAYD